MSDASGPWGPYRATIEDHVDTGADYLGRLRRSPAACHHWHGLRDDDTPLAD